MPTPLELSADGFDLAGLGVTVRDVEQWLAAPRRRHPLADVPGRPDAVLLSVEGIVEARFLGVLGHQEAEDLATLRTRRDELLWRLWGRAVDLVFSDQPERSIIGYLQEGSLPAVPPVFSQTTTELTLRFVCPDPRWMATTESTVALPTGVATEIPLGNAPVSPILTLTGPAASPVVRYRDHAGALIAALDFAGSSIGAGQSLVIDCARATITDGAGANMAHLLYAGTFPRLDARHAASLSGAWGTLEVSAGSGSVTYRKAWL